MNSTDFKKSYLQRIKSIATLYSRVIYRSITNEQMELREEASDELISMLMECFLYNSNCKLFSNILQSVNKTIESNDDDDDENNQIEPPYPSYVSVYQADPRTKILRQYIKRILNYYSGQNMNVSSSDECISMARSDHVSLIN